MSDYFFWCGVIVNAVGAFAVCGLLAWRGLEWWADFAAVKKPMLEYYAQTLRKPPIQPLKGE